MRNRNLAILVVAVVVLGAFILLHERHLPTTDEAGEQVDRVFPGLERDDIQAVEVVNRHGAFRLDRVGDGWRLMEPGPYDADQGAVNAVLGAVVDLEAERTLEADEADLAQLGLEQPELEVVLHTAKGESYRLEVGAQLPLGARRPVAREGGGVMICRSGFAASLDKDLEGWRSRDVVDIFSDQVAAVEVETGAVRAHAAREGRQWQLLEPIRDLAARDHISSLIADLNGLQVKEFVDGDDSGEMGLEAPRHTVTLIRTDAEEPVVLEFGVTRDRDGTTLVACRRDGGETFWVDDGAEQRLAKPPVLWRSRTLYPFDSWNVERLTLTAAGTTVELMREAGLWQLADGGEADTGEATSRLTRLANLETTEFDLVDLGARELGRLELAMRSPGADEGVPPELIEYVFLAPLEEGGDASVRVTGRSGLLGVAAGEVEQLLGDLDSLAVQPTLAAETEAGAE